jgi:hypothetical protein
MHFRDVVLCDNPHCGAILRMTDAPGAISVQLQQAPFGSYIVCPRCDRRTIIELTGAESPVGWSIATSRSVPPST